MDRDEVPGFNHFTQVEKETDVQARGCRRTPALFFCSSISHRKSAWIIRFKLGISSRCHGTSQARRLTPHISSYRAASLPHVSTAFASRILSLVLLLSRGWMISV